MIKIGIMQIALAPIIFIINRRVSAVVVGEVVDVAKDPIIYDPILPQILWKTI